MKKFSQINEATNKDEAHFVKHATSMVKHLDKADHYDYLGRDGRADEHRAKADEHWGHLADRHGADAADHIAAHGANKGSYSEIFSQKSVKGSA